MRNLICILALLVGTKMANAQQMPAYSQYSDNLFLVNPAVAGTSGATVINLTAREQWLGIPGAPKTHTVSIQGRVLKDHFQLKNKIFKEEKIYVSKTKGRIGMGAFVFDDRNGLLNRTGATFAYSYHIRYYKTQYSLGLSFSLFQYGLNRKNILTEENEPLLGYDGFKNIVAPDANVGVHVLNKNYFAGLSCSNLMQTLLSIGNGKFENFDLKRHYYLYGGLNYFPSGKLILTPSALIKTTEQIKNIQADLSLKATWDSKVYLGTSFRTSMDMIFFMGVFYQQFGFGYAYDYAMSSLQNHTYGSHEFTVSMRLGSDERRFRWMERY